MTKTAAAFSSMLIWIMASLPGSAGAQPPAIAQLSLSRAIKIAISDNPVISEYDENQKRAEEETKSARSDFFPKASLAYSYTGLNETPYLQGLGQKLNVSHKDLFHWNFTLTQPLFTGFALSSRYRLSRLAGGAAEMEKVLIAQTITQQVNTAYFNVLQTEKLLQVAEEAVASLTSHAADAEKFYHQGLIPYNDLLRSQVALADAVQNMEKARAGAGISVSALNTLLNRDLNHQTTVEDIGTLPQVTDTLPQLIEMAIANRPELKLLHQALDQSDAGIRIARSAYYPTVALVGRYEQNGKDAAATINDYSNRYNSSVTLLAEWTIFEWGKTRADVSAYRHRKQSLVKTLEDTENQIRLQTKQAYLNLQVAGRNIETATASLTQARENCRITDLQYRQQMATSTDVLDARTFMTRAQTNHYSALYGYMIYLGDLENAVGGKIVDCP